MRYRGFQDTSGALRELEVFLGDSGRIQGRFRYGLGVPGDCMGDPEYFRGVQVVP